MIKEQIKKLVESDNIADDLDDDKLREIADQVIEGLDEDELSMEDWLCDAKKAMDLTDIKREEKNFPFKGAANVKYPLTTLAVVQFTSRTLPELIKNGDVCRYKVVGTYNELKDRKGRRISAHLNYQILEQMPNWLDERDRLLSQLAVVGTCYVKTWYDPITQLNKSELMPFDLIKINDNIKSIEDAYRISQYLYYKKKDILEHIRYDLWRDIDLEMLHEDNDPEDKDTYEFVEQHCYLNLLNDDENDMPQPYIVTIHKKSREVMRIVARFDVKDVKYNKKGKIKCITPQHYFTDYHFIPSPRGKFHSLGYGTLLLDTNAMANSLLNQILNCGTLSMTQGGFYNKELRIRADDFVVEPGEWIPSDAPSAGTLKDSLVPFSYSPPSPVLFDLLSVLLESGKELSSSTEALTGNQDGTNVSPNTLMSLIQEGMRPTVAIQRRIFRGFKKELQKMVRLNAQYLSFEDYIKVIDVSQEEVPEMFSPGGEFIEYDFESVDIVPVADMANSTEAERITKANAAFQSGLQMMQIAPQAVNPQALMKLVFDALDIKEIEMLLPPPPQPGPDLEAIKLQSDVDAKAKDLELKQQELQIKAAQADAQIKLQQTQAVKTMADAQMQATQMEIDGYNKVMDNEANQNQLDIQNVKLQLEAAKLQKDMDKMRIDAHLKSKEIDVKARKERESASKDKSGD